MTQPITNDGILTKSPTNQTTATSSGQSRDSVNSEQPPTERQDSADVERAQQRLMQETTQSNSAGPANADEARELASTVTQQLLADPAGAIRAMGGNVTETLFEAATAQTA